MKKRLVFTVTNDLNFDQRMIRICTSLKNAGYDVLLIGRESTNDLGRQNFPQRRLSVVFKGGKLFYFEYNIRLFFFLLFTKFDLICAIDLDTIIPCYFVSVLKRKKRVYDAHELFCEMKEVVSRPWIHRIWKAIERTYVPCFKYGYTVNSYIRNILKNDYQVDYEIIRNIPPLIELWMESSTEKFILYQGAVNHGRSFETLIPAFKWVDIPFHIYGEGNFKDEAKQLIRKHDLQNKVFLKGTVTPTQLKSITSKALIGITIFENLGLSNYYSLANRFFDYMHAGIPQICVDYPAYSEINEKIKVSVLVSDLSPQSLANTINSLINNKTLQEELRKNCVLARKKYNWQLEEKKLIEFYNSIFSHNSA